MVQNIPFWTITYPNKTEDVISRYSGCLILQRPPIRNLAVKLGRQPIPTRPLPGIEHVVDGRYVTPPQALLSAWGGGRRSRSFLTIRLWVVGMANMLLISWTLISGRAPVPDSVSTIQPMTSFIHAQYPSPGKSFLTDTESLDYPVREGGIPLKVRMLLSNTQCCRSAPPLYREDSAIHITVNMSEDLRIVEWDQLCGR